MKITQKCKIVFLGNNSSFLSISFLKKLIELHGSKNVIAISSGTNFLSDKSFLRKIFLLVKYVTVKELIKKIQQKLTKNDLQSFCENHDIAHYWFKSINSNDAKELISKFSPNCILVHSFSEILKEEIYSIPHDGSYNFHSGNLSTNRGPSPLFWTLFNNENGVTTTCHSINSKIDYGNIFAEHLEPFKSLKDVDNTAVISAEKCLEKFYHNNQKVKKLKEKGTYNKRPTASMKRKLEKMISKRSQS